LAELTEEEFKNHVNSIAAELLEADKTLGQETNRYWREISNECYVFDRGMKRGKESKREQEREKEENRGREERERGREEGEGA
jgi:hypothetical protein